MSSYIYLASPFSHPDPDVMEARYQQVCQATLKLMAKGLVVYSPIGHNYHLAKMGNLPCQYDYWRRFDEVMVGRASELYVCTMDGWDKSFGVKEEMDFASHIGLPISLVCPDTLSVTRLADGKKESSVYRVVELVNTCHACPSQWDGKLDDNRVLYVRFRYGWFSADLDGHTVFESALGDGLDGHISEQDMKDLLSKHGFQFDL